MVDVSMLVNEALEKAGLTYHEAATKLSMNYQRFLHIFIDNGDPSVEELRRTLSVLGFDLVLTIKAKEDK